MPRVMAADDYSPTMTSPRAAYSSPAPAVGSAPSAVSALSAASETLSAAFSAAKMNLQRRRRASAQHAFGLGRRGRTAYVDDEDEDEDDTAFAQPQGHRYQPRPQLQHAQSEPRRTRSQSQRGQSAKSASMRLSSSGNGPRTTAFATVLTMDGSARSARTSARSPSSRSTASASASARSPSSRSTASASASASARSPSARSTASASSSHVQYMDFSSLPELSVDKRSALVNFIDRSVDDAYNLCHGFGRIRWTPSRTREGVSIYRARGEDDTLLDAAVRGNCNVNATFRELTDLLITETTEDFTEHEKAVNPTEFRDGRVLYTLVPRTAEGRFACVKWHSMRSLAPSVAKHRDYIYVELVDRFRDSDGKLVGYRLSKSIELEELPPDDSAFPSVRAKTLTLQTFTERAPGSLELYTMLINDLGERLPAWLVHKIVDTAAMRTACIRDYISQRRIDFLVYANPQRMVPLSRRVCCVVCTRSFSIVRKKYNCAACGDVICNQCSIQQLVTVQQRSSDLTAPGAKRKARICVKCSSGMKGNELPRRSSSVRQSDVTRGSSEGSGRGSVASNSSFLVPQRHSRVSLSKPDESIRRSFLSDGTAGTSSLDSQNSRNSQSYGDDRGSGNGATVSSVRKQVPNMFQFRPSSSLGKSERSSKASTTPSSPGDEGDEHLEVEELQPQLLGDSILAPNVSAPVELDLGVGKYKDTYTQQQTSSRPSLPSRTSLSSRASLPSRPSMPAPTPVPQPERDYAAEAAELAEDDEDEDDDDEYELDDSTGNFLNTEVRRSVSQATVLTLDMDAPMVHKVQKVEVASFLTAEENATASDVSDSDSDTSSYLTVDENSKIVSSRESGGSGALGAPVPVMVEELIVEELQPEKSGSVPRRSLETEEAEVPMVVRKVAKRMLPPGGRRSRDGRRAPAPRPPGAPPAPPAVGVVLSESLASASAAQKQQQASRQPHSSAETESADSTSTASAAPAAEDEVIKLSDLQVHLDRMDQISASLRGMREDMRESTVAPASTQTAMARLTTFETKANAERAAKIAANFISLLDRQAAPVARRAQQYLQRRRDGPKTSLFNLTLAMGDGSFIDYLADSEFEDVGETPDGSGLGWQAVLSQTTGKEYFFNENCALASWTLPGPDVFCGAVYMVL